MTPEQCAELSRQLRQRADELATFADYCLDVSVATCECCGSTRYNNWPQKQVHEQLAGAVQRLHNIAHTLDRRASDPQFIGKVL